MANEEAKLFVAGLPDSVSEEVLKQLFEATGGTVVNVSLPKDRATGRPRGFGFVTLSTLPRRRPRATRSTARCRRANRSPFGHSRPSLRAARGQARVAAGPRSYGGPRRSGGPPGRRTRGGRRAPDRTLYVGNLPYDCTQQEIETLINGVAAASVVRVHLPIDPDGRKRGFGFVTMASAETAKAAPRRAAAGRL